LTIAIWGAILSTILAIREVSRERRKISITLFKISWMESYKISITNTGHRPITISEISLTIKTKAKAPHSPIRASARFATAEGYTPQKLPLILTDGQTAEFHLSEYVTHELSNELNKLLISVYDSEGNIYKRYRNSMHDPKYAYIDKK
jgi:hypothetical protein